MRIPNEGKSNPTSRNKSLMRVLSSSRLPKDFFTKNALDFTFMPMKETVKKRVKG